MRNPTTQPALTASAVGKIPEGGRIIIADHAAGGDHFEAALLTTMASANRPDLVISRHSPETPNEDWNDVLQNRGKGT